MLIFFKKKSIFANITIKETYNMHSKFKWIFVFTAFLFVVSPAFSQKDFTPFGNLGLGVKVSTFGYGVEAATPLNKMFILRAGVNWGSPIGDLLSTIFGDLNISLFDTDGKFLDSFGYMPELKIKPVFDFMHGNLLLDFHPAGIFHLTAGVFVGSSNIKIDGRLVDSNDNNSQLLPGKDWPVYDIGDQKIDLKGGQANIDLLLGNTLKPYLGLGLGRAVPKNRLSFKFELGVVFQKGYSLRQNNVVFDLAATNEQNLQGIHESIMQYGKLWPMMNFQLSYRIF